LLFAVAAVLHLLHSFGLYDCSRMLSILPLHTVLAHDKHCVVFVCVTATSRYDKKSCEQVGWCQSRPMLRRLSPVDYLYVSNV